MSDTVALKDVEHDIAEDKAGRAASGVLPPQRLIVPIEARDSAPAVDEATIG